MYDWNKKHNSEPELPPLSRQERMGKFTRDSAFGSLENAMDKFGAGRVFWCIFAVLAALIIIIAVAGARTSQRVEFMGNTLRIVSVQRGTGLTMTDQNGETLTMTLRIDPSSFTTYTINYLGKTFSYRSLSDHDYRFSCGHQFIVSFHSARIVPVGLTAQQQAEANILRSLRIIHHNHTPLHSVIGNTLLGLAILAFGVAELLFPEAFWKLRHIFSVRGGEPTDFALFMHRLSGVMIVVIAFVFALL